MEPRIQAQTVMKCFFCKFGEVAPGKARAVFERNGVTVVIEDVPAEICDSCGEYYLSAEVAEVVHALAERALDKGGVANVMKYAA